MHYIRFTDDRRGQCPYCLENIGLDQGDGTRVKYFMEIRSCSACGQKLTMEDREFVEKSANTQDINLIKNNWLEWTVFFIIFLTIIFSLIYVFDLPIYK